MYYVQNATSFPDFLRLLLCDWQFGDLYKAFQSCSWILSFKKLTLWVEGDEGLKLAKDIVVEARENFLCELL